MALFLCSVFMACTRENPKTGIWRDRLVHARLSGADWKPFRQSAYVRTSCDPVRSREEALNLLAIAGRECLDTALNAVATHAKEDLAAAYLTRFDRNGDPVDLLRALETAEGFNRALAQEWLGLTKEALHSWNELVTEKSGWSDEARQHLQRLQKLRDPLWNEEEVQSAFERHDAAALRRIVHAFPVEAAWSFEKSNLFDREGARLFATILADNGQMYPQAVVDVMDQARDRAALTAFKDKDYLRAATLLERVGNPLHLAALYYDGSLPALERAIPHLKPEYRELSARIHMYRANLLEFTDRYLEAHAEYDKALAFAKGEPTLIAATRARRSENFRTIGASEDAFRDAFRAVSLLNRVASTNARHLSYGAAANAARQLGYPLVALHYQNAAVEDIQRAMSGAHAKAELSGALRVRAEILVALGQEADAERDLQQAAEFAQAVEPAVSRDLMRMRVLDARGQLLLRTRPVEAEAALTEAIELAKEQDSTYRATLHLKRAEARRNTNDIATALQILRNEVQHALTSNPQSASDPLWTPYFLRFQDQQDALIEGRIAANDIEGAFVDDELARAFEPMQILLQSRPGFQSIESLAGLRQARANLPEDTVILQYLVLPQRTYTWVVTRERIVLVPQRATKVDVERWADDVLKIVKTKQPDLLPRVMRTVYGELFRVPLARAASKTRVVIVPDDPMQGLPFNALAGTRNEGYLIERASIATSGSTSLYLYALARDRQLSAKRNPAVLLVGDPAFESKMFPRLPHAKQEVAELSRDHYPDAVTLTDTAATVEGFLDALKNATIVHFAGHALAIPEKPWQSRLLLAQHGRESGELNAQRLMQELPRLDRTRLVVLGACRTAGGASVGPQGLAPLVRSLIAAEVPAVAGSLWDVRDASAKDLLVLLHCHYRHGDDVAVALRNAQLERLRNNDSAMAWAAFQVVGYAASPWPRTIALEEPSSEHLCTQNSLLRPDGLHSQ